MLRSRPDVFTRTMPWCSRIARPRGRSVEAARLSFADMSVWSYSAPREEGNAPTPNSLVICSLKEISMSVAQAANSLTDSNLDQLCVNTIRTLSIDAVQQARSGHPGTPMALAPLIYTIWNRVLRFDPKDPIWPNRDRFVLSNGHASMLLWSALHLSRIQAVNADYERLDHPSVSLEYIRHFHQLDSKAPGHTAYHWDLGVETTT